MYHTRRCNTSSRTTGIVTKLGLLLLFVPFWSPLMTGPFTQCGTDGSLSYYFTCSISIFLGLPQVRLVSARSLNSRELLACPSSSSVPAHYNNEGNDEGRVGTWNVTFRSSWRPLLPGQQNNCHPMDALVFPAAKTTITPDESSVAQRQQGHRKKRLLPTFRRYDECKLSLFSNGTFAIIPPRADETSSSASSKLLAIHGKWKVQTNPYCATDRFFHQVCLESYPRLQTTTTRTTKSAASHDSNELVQPTIQQEQQQRRVKFLMHCRLLGHYSAGREGGILLPRLKSLFLQQKERSYYHAKGRLVRGTLLMEEEEDLTQQPVAYKSNNNNNDKHPSIQHGSWWLMQWPRTRAFFGNVKHNKRRRRIALASFTAQRHITFQELLRLYDDDDEDEESLLLEEND